MVQTVKHVLSCLLGVLLVPVMLMASDKAQAPLTLENKPVWLVFKLGQSAELSQQETTFIEELSLVSLDAAVTSEEAPTDFVEMGLEQQGDMARSQGEGAAVVLWLSPKRPTAQCASSDRPPGCPPDRAPPCERGPGRAPQVSRSRRIAPSWPRLERLAPNGRSLDRRSTGRPVPTSVVDP